MSTVYHIYCDESRQVKERFMVLGGIITEAYTTPVVEKTMANYRSETKMFSELKWSKVSNQKIDQYQRFIDYFFSLNNSNNLHFKCIIIDNHQLNHKKFSDGDKEKTFYKLYYQLIIHCFSKSFNPNDSRIIIYMDQRSSKYKLSELKDILNAGISKKTGVRISPFVSIEPVDSKSRELIQINDLLIGAVGYHKNGFHIIAGSNLGKRKLAGYIAWKAGIKDLTQDTAWGIHRFKIWNFKLQK